MLKIARKFFYNQIKIRDPKTNNFNSLPATTGESAYQLAVRLGTFSGTEEEYNTWLNKKREDALNDIAQAKNQSTKAVIDEGAKQIQNVEAVIDGIAQDTTAREILSKENQSVKFLETIALAAGKAGSLNGFGLEKGLNDSVIISYANPETDILEGSVTLPRDSTLIKIQETMKSINSSLKLIAIRNGVTF